MTTATLTVTETILFTVIDCGECGTKFAMTNEFIAERRHDHRGWYCPNGHQRHYPAKNKEEVLKAQLEAKEAQLRQIANERDLEQSRAAKAERALKTAKVAAKTVATRIAAGVCPCCNRTFKQLAAHMKNKHPEHAA